MTEDMVSEIALTTFLSICVICYTWLKVVKYKYFNEDNDE